MLRSPAWPTGSYPTPPAPPQPHVLRVCAAKLWSIPQYLHMIWSGPFQVRSGVLFCTALCCERRPGQAASAGRLQLQGVC